MRIATMSRYETPFLVTLTHDQTRHLATADRLTAPGQLAVHVHGDSLRASWPPANSFDHPPTCLAQIRAVPDGAEVSGTIREASGSMFWARAWILPAVVVVGVAIAGLALLIFADGSHDALGALIFGGVGTLIVVPMWQWQRRLRTSGYRDDVQTLADGLNRYLTTGDSSRHWARPPAR